VTGDNIRYSSSQYINRLNRVFYGEAGAGLKGLIDFNAATFVNPGNHDFEQDQENWGCCYESKSDYWNTNWGLQMHFFKYGNGRYMMINDGWDDFDYSYQTSAGTAWLQTDGAGGNFQMAAFHKKEAGSMGSWSGQINNDLLLFGHDHHKGDSNPVVLDSRFLGYYSLSLIEYAEFGLYRIDNATGSFTPLGYVNTYSGSDGFGEITGMNQFLEALDITMRRDVESHRPRVNKNGSQMDTKQKSENKRYYL